MKKNISFNLNNNTRFIPLGDMHSKIELGTLRHSSHRDYMLDFNCIWDTLGNNTHYSLHATIKNVTAQGLSALAEITCLWQTIAFCPFNTYLSESASSRSKSFQVLIHISCSRSTMLKPIADELRVLNPASMPNLMKRAVCEIYSHSPSQ